MTLLRLALALGIGLLIGLERGWKAREAPDGGRVAGLRTFGLIGLLGGIWGALAATLGVAALVAAFLALAALLALGYRATSERKQGLGVTTEVAGLVTFALGAMAVVGLEKEAVFAAVVTTALLGFKPVLHHWLERIGRAELEAVLKFLIISVAVLPNLPDRGFGPWEALNPYHIWWMVVLIAGISFAGYIAVKLLGSRGGLLATSVLGGLVSSTAVTLALSRLNARQPRATRLHAAGIVVASTIMFPRILLETAAVNHGLLPLLAPPIAVMACVGLLGTALLMLGAESDGHGEPPAFKNPLELSGALFFGGALALVTFAGVALHHLFGESGVYATALTAGVMDVDAVTLSMSRLALDGALSSDAAANAILAAAGANTASKMAMAAAIARGRMGLLASSVLGAALLAGAAVLALLRTSPL
ncbi:MAG: MgtC/SapB family protein [Elusimicrobiota bacterium]|nr:MgtC/SapB family protein [Elusimicrobiota bacterium]